VRADFLDFDSRRVKEFFILLLLLETASSESSLRLICSCSTSSGSDAIPMALLIGMYGHGRKVYAAAKYFLFTMIGSMFMLRRFYGSTPRPAALISS